MHTHPRRAFSPCQRKPDSSPSPQLQPCAIFPRRQVATRVVRMSFIDLRPSNALPITCGPAARYGLSMILRCACGGTDRFIGLVRRHHRRVAVTPFDPVPSSWIACAPPSENLIGAFGRGHQVCPMPRRLSAGDRRSRESKDVEGHFATAACIRPRGLPARCRRRPEGGELAEESRMRQAKRPLREQPAGLRSGVTVRTARLVSASPAHA